MTILNMGTDTAPKWFAVATVSINGKEQEIIPAFTEYSIQRKDFSKDKIYEKIDKSKILPTVFCFAKPDIFIKENVRLFDYSGRELTDVPNEAPQIMVYLDKADNINLLDLDIPLKAEAKAVNEQAAALPATVPVYGSINAAAFLPGSRTCQVRSGSWKTRKPLSCVDPGNCRRADSISSSAGSGAFPAFSTK